MNRGSPSNKANPQARVSRSENNKRAPAVCQRNKGDVWKVLRHIECKDGISESWPVANPLYRLHDLVLRQATMGICVHRLVTTLVEVFDETQVERAATVLVSLELRNGSIGSIRAVETNDTAATRSAAGLVLNLGLLNLADSSEELYQVVVASGPWKLESRVSVKPHAGVEYGVLTLRT
jgi:hypothetical protein